MHKNFEKKQKERKTLVLSFCGVVDIRLVSLRGFFWWPSLQ